MPSSNKDSDSSANKIQTGRSFEERTAQFYQDNGFEIVARNWRAGHKEIDLIVRREGLLVFVEVKSSRSKLFGHPSERVDRKKRGHLVEAAQRFIVESKLSGIDFRFDVVTFVGGELEHYPDAFDTTF